MQDPSVSFVIPCYKLGHFLLDCVTSILDQTWSDFEVLIMDDCSPDTTPEVAASLKDRRVKYIRNEANLGHIANYKRGIALTRGRYIWLISADDRLRRRYVLQRYVHLMEHYHNVGYVFCPGLGLSNGAETRLLRSHAYGNADRVIDGHEFIAGVLSKPGGLLAPSVMARRECYEKIANFPEDMPHQGDMFIWFMWALRYDVGYFAEPMVNYRDHENNMMKAYLRYDPMRVFSDEVNVLWRTKREAKRLGCAELDERLEFFISEKYAGAVSFLLYKEATSVWGMTPSDCEEKLRENAENPKEFKRLRDGFYALVAEAHWRHHYFREARRTIAIAGDYSGARNLGEEVLKSLDLKYMERWRLADLNLGAARLYWLQGRILRGLRFASHALLIWPAIVGRPLKTLSRRYFPA